MLTLLWRHRGYTGLRFFWIREQPLTTLGLREKFSLGILVELEVSLDSKRCRSLFELEVFQVRKLELYLGHGTICWKLCSSKVENSEEKTRRLRIGLSAEFLYSMTCVVICSHRRSHLKSFLQGIFIVRIGGGTFFRLRQNIKESIHLRAINLTNPHLARTKSFAE